MTSDPGRIQLRPVTPDRGPDCHLFRGCWSRPLLQALQRCASQRSSLRWTSSPQGRRRSSLPRTVTYFEKEHVYLVRFADGAFLALYDLSPATQTLVSDGDLTKLTCRAADDRGRSRRRAPRQRHARTWFRVHRLRRFLQRRNLGRRRHARRWPGGWAPRPLPRGRDQRASCASTLATGAATPTLRM